MRAKYSVWAARTDWLLAAMLAASCGACRQYTAGPASSAEPPIESGIYGFSGAGVPDTEPEGVVGECIWVFDERNRQQLAEGECDERSPGRFRVVLKPGHYIVRGPGGNTAVEVKRGAWVKIESVASLPLAP